MLDVANFYLLINGRSILVSLFQARLNIYSFICTAQCYPSVGTINNNKGCTLSGLPCEILKVGKMAANLH